MPEINDYFSTTRDMDLPTLHMRREEIRMSAPDGDYAKLSDELLSELLAINRALRKKIAHSSPKRTATPTTKKAMTLEDLA